MQEGQGRQSGGYAERLARYIEVAAGSLHAVTILVDRDFQHGACIEVGGTGCQL